MKSEHLTVTVAHLDLAEDAASWDQFVNSRSEAVNYHQSRWLQVITRAFGHEICPLWVHDTSRSVCGVLPIVHMKSALFGDTLVSLPFFNYGGVLARDEHAQRALLVKGEELLKQFGTNGLELRHVGKSIAGLPTKTHKVTMTLELPDDSDVLWKSFKPKVRNQVRKAEKSGLKVISGGSELLDDFYAVFARNMRDLGTPVYSKNFFATILEFFPESTRLFLVKHTDGCVACGFGTWFKGVFEIPWASSIREYNHLCPNNLLYWELLQYACSIGCHCFDFGRSTPHKGTYRFKKQWGASQVQLYWQYLLSEGQEIPEVNPDNPKYRMAIKIWQKLPLPLTKIIGPHIVRNIP